MPIVADAAVAVRGDFSKFPTDLKKAEGPITSLGDKLKNALSPKAALVGLGAGLAGIFAASKVADFIGDAISAASNLNESLGKSQVVFGDSADAIERWAEDSAQAFGQSKQAALEAAGTYGNLFQAFGVGQLEAAKMSQSLVELAADLASFNNTSVDDALVALRSGLSGETEPLKRYGIAISDARLRTELMNQGVKNLGATLTPLQKSTASYALIMKDSALAQGDFARTSDGLANSQRSLEAEMANLSAEVGEVLLPFIKDLTIYARDEAVPALREIGKQIGIIIKGATRIKNAPGKGADWLAGLFGLEPDTRSRLQKRITQGTHHLFGAVTATLDADAARWAGNTTSFTDYVEAGLREGEPGVRDSSAYAISVPITDAVKKANAEAAAKAREIPGNISKALIAGQEDLNTGLDALKELMKTSLSDAQKIAHDEAILVDPAIKAALLDERADVRGAAQQLVTDATEELALLKSGAYDAAVDAGTTLDEQLRLQREKVTRAMAYALQGARQNLESGWDTPGITPPTTPTRPGQRPLPLGNLQTGSLSIPQTGPYNLHASEMVVPPGAAAALRDFFGSGGMGMPASVTNIWNLSVNGVPYRFETRDDFMKGLDTLSSFTGDGRLPDNG